MISPARAWKILGLAPCDDERQVRRAYATKLKSINPDEDIDGFQQLRNAFELAKRDAIWRKQGAEQDVNISADDFTGTTGLDEFAGDALVEDDSSKTITPAVEDQPVDPAREHADDLQSALFVEKFSPFHAQAAAKAVEQLLADERMENVEYAQNVEGYLASILGDTIPRSDQAIVVADRHFGWRHELQKASHDWHLDRVAVRASDLECIDALLDPKHKWHEAYKAICLGSPDNVQYSQRVKLAPEVRDLVASLRYHNPRVEEECANPDGVAEWLKFAGGGPSADLIGGPGVSWYVILVALFILLQLVTFFVRFAG